MKFKWDIFISYNNADFDKAEFIYEDLQRAGLEVWFDRREVYGGDRLREKINEGIRKSRIVLVLLSKNSLKSQWVLNELDAAMMREIDENRKVAVAALVGRIDDNEVPPDLRGKSYYDFRHNFEKKYTEQRVNLINTASSWFSYINDGYEIIPMDEELFTRISQFRYDVKDPKIREYTDQLMKVMGTQEFWDEMEGNEDSGDDSKFSIFSEYEKFLEQYGANGARLVTILF